VGSLQEIQDRRSPAYPFYCAALYTPEPGLDRELHATTVEGAYYLDRQTGENCLLLLVEDPEVVRGRWPWRAAQIEEATARERRPVRPEGVYDIARALGVAFESLPALVFFTEPAARRDGLQLKLAEFLPAERRSEDLVKAYRAIADALERRASAPQDQRLNLLRNDLVGGARAAIRACGRAVSVRPGDLRRPARRSSSRSSS
jgi:hypothetical protein